MSSEQDNALYVAQFLASFQDYFQGSDDRLEDPVSKQDLHDAIVYRQLLVRLENLQSDYNSLHQHASPEQHAQYKVKIQEFEKEITDLRKTNTHVHVVHRMLLRFEVWATRDVSRTALVYTKPSKCNAKPAVECVPLLNMPCASYFGGIVPTSQQEQPALQGDNIVDDSAAPVDLPLPPNVWTWTEYQRLVEMVMKLPQPKAATLSPLTAVSNSLMHTPNQRQELHLLHSSQYSQGDLVALWIRAQRNTSARLQLIQLFQLVNVAQPRMKIMGGGGGGGRKPGGGKQLVLQQQDDDDESDKPPPQYVAKFVGNTGKIKAIVQQESHVVDRLVEWAVVNQLLFTHAYIKQAIQADMISYCDKASPLAATESNKAAASQDTSAGSDSAQALGESMQVDETAAEPDSVEPARAKRPLQDDEESRPLPPAKRSRAAENDNDASESNADNDDDKLLQQAAQTYVLRWFARRNRKATSVLFDDLIDADSLPIYGRLVKDLRERNIRKAIKSRKDEKAKDRLLIRVDRRIPHGKYQVGAYDFRQVIPALLQALKGSLFEDADLTAEDVSNAMADFEALYSACCNDDGSINAAKLIDELPQDANLADTLKSLPPPWARDCTICNEEVKDAPFRTCHCCEAVVHQECCNKKDGSGEKFMRSVSFRDIVNAYQPLHKVYRVRNPRNKDIPNFEEGIEWKRIEVEADMQVIKGSNGATRRFGASIQHTDFCERLLDDLLSGKACASTLMESKNRNARPCSLGHFGMLVYDIHDELGAARAAGIRVSDLLVGFRKDGKFIEFKSIPRGERVNVLRQNGKVQLILLRPSKDISSLSNMWLRAVKKASQAQTAVFDEETTASKGSFWCCSTCLSKESISNKDVVEEAKQCRALVRRLGMESYALPFVEETTCASDGDGSNHTQHAGLRRLEHMMSSIISSSGRCLSPKNNGEISVEMAPFYALPQSASPDDDESAGLVVQNCLEWARPAVASRPIHLVCKAMSILLTPPWALAQNDGREDIFREERRALSVHFISLFSAWCLGRTFDFNLFSTMGPPKWALSLREPWLISNCRICLIQPRDDGCTDDTSLCRDSRCRQLLAHRNSVNVDMEVVEDKPKDGGGAGKIVTDDSSSENVEPDQADPSPSAAIPILSIDEKVKTYQRFASFVGTVILVLPEDDLLHSVSAALGWNIEHMNRPVTFIVASYLPWHYEAPLPMNPGYHGQTDGTFWLLPVLGLPQLRHVEGECKIRNPPASLNVSVSNTKWTNLHVLDLKGIVRCSPDELIKRIHQTAAVSDAIDHAISSIAGCVTEQELSEFQDTGASDITLCDGIDSNTLYSRDGRDTVSKLLWSRSKFGDELSSELPNGSSPSPAEPDHDANATLETIVRYQSIIENLVASDSPTIRKSTCNSDTTKTPQLGNLSNDAEEYGEQPQQHAATRQVSMPYHVFYSDLSNDTDEVLQPPEPNETMGRTSTCIVHLNRKQKSRNWGYEVVQWECEDDRHILRVGRMHPRLAAYESGLSPGDIIRSINGVEAPDFGVKASDCHDPDVGVPRFLRPLQETRGGAVVVVDRAISSEEHVLGAATGQNQRQSSGAESHERLPREEITATAPNPAALQHSADERHSAGQGQQTAERMVPIPGSTVQARRAISPYDIHRQGPNGIFLTRVEAAVAVAAIHRQQPLLGVRLLCPRYDWNTATSQCATIGRNLPYYLPNLPAVPPEFWNLILRVDFERSQREQGEFFIREGNFHYRLPTIPLELDRLASYFIRGASHAATSSNTVDLTENDGEPADTEDDLNSLRIRGGGLDPESTENASKLTLVLNGANWEDQAVWGACDTTDDGHHVGTAKFIGYVAKNPTGAVMDGTDIQVEVSAVDISNVDTELDEPVPMTVDSSSLYAVAAGSPEAEIVLNWCANKGYPNVRVYENVEKSVPPQLESAGAQSNLNSVESFTSRLEHSARLYLSRLITLSKRLEPLGLLPDGRAIYWFSSDPRALFVNSICQPGCDRSILEASLQNAQQGLRDEVRKGNQVESSRLLLEPSSSDSHVCPWGCTTKSRESSTRKMQPFATLTDLVYHIESHHRYNDSTFSGNFPGLARIPEGRRIQVLFAHLTGAITARTGHRPDLVHELTSLEGDPTCFLNQSLFTLRADKVLSVNGSGNLSFNSSIRDPRASTTCVRIQQLWYRLTCLFDVSDGLLRVRSGLLSLTATGDRTSRELPSSLEAHGGGMENDSLPKGSSAPVSFNSLDSDFCTRGDSSHSPLGSARDVISLNPLIAAKSFLLELGKKMPDALRLEPTSTVVTTNKHLWEEDQYQCWCAIIETSRDLQLMLQAFVVLLHSIEKKKMPKWWQASRGGWSDPLTVMMLPSSASLLLHLYVLDVAVCEFEAGKKSHASGGTTNPFPPELLKLDIADRFAKIVEWAEAVPVEPHEEHPNYTCDKCDEGGELLCCEFCETVRHCYCCEPQIQNPSVVNKWVCDSCVTDISEFYESTKA